MMNSNTDTNLLTLGYDLNKWIIYGLKESITIDISSAINSHMLLCGMSGSGKTYAGQCFLAKMTLAQQNNMVYFANYKDDDAFAFLRNSPRYYSYKNTLDALDEVYQILNNRLSEKDESYHPVTLFWDEYMANILALSNEDKKLATVTMNKISEILLMGRSLSVRLVCLCQRPDALAFPAGSRLNYGIVVILGAYIRSIYEMLMPDHKEQIEQYQFGRGEGVVLLQGSELRFIKIPTVHDNERMKQLCIQALS